MTDPASLKLPVLASSIASLWLAESFAPHFAAFVRDVRARRLHALRNAALAVINGLLGVAILGGLIARSAVFAESHNFGLLRLATLPAWTAAIASLLLFDCWMYCWHRINHAVAFLWRFHRVHHSDPRMDVTTALRFHPGEIMLSTLARLLVVNLIGMELWHLALYELIALPVVAFHHSNIALPRRADDALRWLMVTPWMHWVHHSTERAETNSNYSSVLSPWDRLVGNYRLRDNPDGSAFGLDEFPDEARHQGVGGMMASPTRSPGRENTDACRSCLAVGGGGTLGNCVLGRERAARPRHQPHRQRLHHRRPILSPARGHQSVQLPHRPARRANFSVSASPPNAVAGTAGSNSNRFEPALDCLRTPRSRLLTPGHLAVEQRCPKTKQKAGYCDGNTSR